METDVPTTMGDLGHAQEHNAVHNESGWHNSNMAQFTTTCPGPINNHGCPFAEHLFHMPETCGALTTPDFPLPLVFPTLSLAPLQARSGTAIAIKETFPPNPVLDH